VKLYELMEDGNQRLKINISRMLQNYSNILIFFPSVDAAAIFELINFIKNTGCSYARIHQFWIKSCKSRYRSIVQTKRCCIRVFTFLKRGLLVMPYFLNRIYVSCPSDCFYIYKYYHRTINYCTLMENVMMVMQDIITVRPMLLLNLR